MIFLMYSSELLKLVYMIVEYSLDFMKFRKIFDRYSTITSGISSVLVSFRFLNIVSIVLGSLLFIRFFSKYFSFDIIERISPNYT
jgi:hypothetical protein